MRRFLGLVGLVLAVSGPAYAQTAAPAAPAQEVTISPCALSSGTRTNDSEARFRINCLLDAFNDAAAHADGPRYFGMFAPNAVFVGTDATERWTVEEFRAFAEPYFAQGKGWTYVPTSRTITLADCLCMAWFEENLHSESYGTTRGTGVVIKDGSGWKVAQYVLTIPLPNDISKDIVAQIKAYEAAHPKP
jgi:hypothetical protein